MRPSGGAGPLAHVCQGDTRSAAYEETYISPFGPAATAGNTMSTRWLAGAFSVLPSGCVTGYPTAVLVAASSAGKAAAGVLQVMPPSRDSLYTIVEWQFARTALAPAMKYAQ